MPKVRLPLPYRSCRRFDLPFDLYWVSLLDRLILVLIRFQNIGLFRIVALDEAKSFFIPLLFDLFAFVELRLQLGQSLRVPNDDC